MVKFGWNVLLIVVTAIVTLILTSFWMMPTTVATKSEVTSMISEAKAESKSDFCKLDEKKLDKDTFATYVKQDSELRDLIVERQNAQHNYIVELQKKVHK